MSISTTLFGEISHASLFFTGQLRNPWQMLAEPWGSAEPRLKNTGVINLGSCILKVKIVIIPRNFLNFVICNEFLHTKIIMPYSGTYYLYC